LPKSGRGRAVYLETRQHGSGRGGWNRARSRLAVIAEANGRVNELRRKPSTSPAAYSTRSRSRLKVGRGERVVRGQGPQRPLANGSAGSSAGLTRDSAPRRNRPKPNIDTGGEFPSGAAEPGSG